MTAIAAILDLVPKWAYALAVAALVAVTGVQWIYIEELRLGKAKDEAAIYDLRATIAINDAAAQSERARFAEQARKAEQARSAREAALAADSADARRELERLRVQLAKATGGSADGADATRFDPAAAVDDLLEVSRRYVEVSEKCDRHVTDLQTLIDAWPKTQK